MRTTVALMIVTLALTTAAVAAPASATKTHHGRRQPPPFSMSDCLKAAAPLYNPSEARAVCRDLRAGV